MIDKAIINLRPGAQWILNGEYYEGLQWIDEIQSKPSKEEVEAEIIKLNAEYDSKQYQRLRVKEYPSMQEQLDMQYWDSINGTTTWQDTINAIKVKYPKPEGV